MPKPKLIGHVAIVTGGAGGIGGKVCLLFAQEGASVCIVDVNKQGMDEILQLLPRDHGNDHCVIEADVSNAECVKSVFSTIEETLHKKATILINNAGVDAKPTLVGDLDEEYIDRVLNINLKGKILMANEFVKQLKASKSGLQGCLVNISSMAGKIGSAQGSVYSASKAGVIGLTKSIALEFPYSKVRCNAILPGAIDTPLFARVRQSLDNVELMMSMVPLQSVGKPEDVAEACLYLASDQSSYVNGALLDVAGGFGC